MNEIRCTTAAGLENAVVSCDSDDGGESWRVRVRNTGELTMLS